MTDERGSSGTPQEDLLSPLRDAALPTQANGADPEHAHGSATAAAPVQSAEHVAEHMPAVEPLQMSQIDMLKIAPTRDERLFLVLSIFIGIISGLLVVSFRIAINWVQVLTLGSAPHPGQLRLIVVPLAMGALVAFLVQRFFPGARGSGVNNTKSALYIYNGFISFKTVIGKYITSALALGGGFSLGPEDPSLQIGAGVASMVSRRLGLSRQRLRLFAPVGAAAGLAAAFNAPISAILFVIEEVIGRWSAAVLGSIVLSAISSVVVARRFWGSQPMFEVPPITGTDSRELLAYAVLGVVGGVAASIFSRALGYLRPRMRNLPRWTYYVQPPIAGLAVGLIGFFGFPEIMGPGYEVMDHAMHGQFTWQLLLGLALLKILATTVSFSSGTPGGMFAPTLFIGAMLGASIGTFEKVFFPAVHITVGSYALVGMGVLFAAFLRVPLTSVFMVLEVSGNYSIILPVILANTIAYLVSRSLQPSAIFEVFTHQDGLDLPSMEEQREEVVLHLEDALRPLQVPILEGNTLLSDAGNNLDLQHAEVFFIRLPGHAWYSMTRAELASLAAVSPPETVLASVLKPERIPLLFPDLPLDSALPHLARWPILPVQNRASRGSIEGTLTLSDVLSRYQAT